MIAISVGNFSVIDPDLAKRREWPMVRFGVTISQDGKPLWTSLGWLMLADRTIRPPGVRSSSTRFTAFHEIDPKFITMVTNAVLSYPAVGRALGPVVDFETERKRKKQRDQLPVEPRVVMEDEG